MGYTKRNNDGGQASPKQLEELLERDVKAGVTRRAKAAARKASHGHTSTTHQVITSARKVEGIKRVLARKIEQALETNQVKDLKCLVEAYTGINPEAIISMMEVNYSDKELKAIRLEFVIAVQATPDAQRLVPDTMPGIQQSWFIQLMRQSTRRLERGVYSETTSRSAVVATRVASAMLQPA